MKNAPTHYLYVLVDPRTEAVFYVGISVNPKNRLVQHLKTNNRAYKTNSLKAKLVRQIKKLGLKPRMEIVDELPESMIAQAERDWIYHLGRFFKLTNVSPGGGLASEATRKKMSEANKGTVFSQERKRKISEAKKGKPNGRKGITHSEEAKFKISKAKKGKPNGREGLTHSEEVRRKISEAKKGKSNGREGLTHSEETKRKLSESRRGKVLSEETKLKMSEAKKIYWASKKAA